MIEADKACPNMTADVPRICVFDIFVTIKLH